MSTDSDLIVSLAAMAADQGQMTEAEQSQVASLVLRLRAEEALGRTGAIKDWPMTTERAVEDDEHYSLLLSPARTEFGLSFHVQLLCCDDCRALVGQSRAHDQRCTGRVQTEVRKPTTVNREPRCGDCGLPYDVPSDDGCTRHPSRVEGADRQRKGAHREPQPAVCMIPACGCSGEVHA